MLSLPEGTRPRRLRPIPWAPVLGSQRASRGEEGRNLSLRGNLVQDLTCKGTHKRPSNARATDKRQKCLSVLLCKHRLRGRFAARAYNVSLPLTQNATKSRKKKKEGDTTTASASSVHVRKQTDILFMFSQLIFTYNNSFISLNGHGP